MKKTLYIALEGGDGSGKSTLIQNLLNHFISENKTVLLTKEFGSPLDKFCQDLRSFALSDRFDIDEKAGQILFGAIIKQHQEKVLKPAFGKYDIILSDRGPYSNYTYGPAHGVDEKFIKSFFDMVYENAPWPDLSLFINMPNEVATQRRLARTAETFDGGGKDRIEAKGSDFQQKVSDNFLKIAAQDNRLAIINATGAMSPIDLLNEAVSIINTKLG